MATTNTSGTVGFALPAYARLVDAPGGAWRRFWLYAWLRLTVKRLLVLNVDVARLRRRQEQIDERFGKVDPEVRRTPVDAGGATSEWINAPESRDGRTLLYFHGGAFMLRFPRTHAALVSGWCRALGARALMVDYRLAPEHPYPAAPDDCLAAYRWLLAQGVRAEDIVFGGDSAGGNLALVTLLRCKAAGLPMPRCAVLLSPFVDFTLSSRSLIVNEQRDPMFTLAGIATTRLLYAGPEAYVDPAVSPLFGDFAGLPPLLFHAGDDEMLLDESVRAAACAHAAGVSATLTVWKHMVHVFHVFPLPQAAVANAQIVEFIRGCTGWVR